MSWVNLGSPKASVSSRSSCCWPPVVDRARPAALEQRGEVARRAARDVPADRNHLALRRPEGDVDRLVAEHPAAGDACHESVRIAVAKCFATSPAFTSMRLVPEVGEKLIAITRPTSRPPSHTGASVLQSLHVLEVHVVADLPVEEVVGLSDQEDHHRQQGQAEGDEHACPDDGAALLLLRRLLRHATPPSAPLLGRRASRKAADLAHLAGLHLRHRPHVDDLPAGKHGHPVGDVEGRLHVVGDHDRGARRSSLLQLEDQLVDDAGADRIEAGGGLVVEDHLGLDGDGARQAHALLHAAGEVGRAASARCPGRFHQLQRLGHPLRQLVLGQLRQVLVQRVGDVLSHGERVEERRRPGRPSPPAARTSRNSCSPRVVTSCAVEADAAAVGVDAGR